ncbi:MGMT family protein, partial [Candidatus Saccharibacteria bacterium]|nr:MGMT family protein [Candidatus Saccharibacteria bacterium]
LTAGIFTNIVANANEERDGKNPTAWWRTLKADGELNPKYPNFPDMQKQLLEQEGHTIIQKGKRYFVADFEKKLYNFS